MFSVFNFSTLTIGIIYDVCVAFKLTVFESRRISFFKILLVTTKIACFNAHILNVVLKYPTLIFMSSKPYALCIETKRNFVK